MDIHWTSKKQFTDIKYEIGSGESKGINKISRNQPLFPTSCKRLTVIDVVGMAISGRKARTKMLTCGSM